MTVSAVDFVDGERELRENLMAPMWQNTAMGLHTRAAEQFETLCCNKKGAGNLAGLVHQHIEY